MQNIAVAFVHAQSQPMYDDFNYIKTHIFFTPQRFYFEWFPCYLSTVLHLFSLLFSDFLTLIKQLYVLHFISLSLSLSLSSIFSDFF